MNTPLLAGFGPFGTSEMIVIAIIVLVLFGAKKLPIFARSLGTSLGEFRRAKDQFEEEMRRASQETERAPEKERAEAPKKTIEVDRQRDHEEA